MHAGRVPPQEERLAFVLGFFHETHGFPGNLLVHRFHALLAERAGAHDLLRAARVGPAVDHAARRIALAQFGILAVVRVLGFVFGSCRINER
ncbi:hypothetical protein D9M70_285590 [compost metagenome]